MHNLHYTTAVFFLNPLYLFCHVFSKLNIYKYNTICLHCYISVIYTTGLTKDAIHILCISTSSAFCPKISKPTSETPQPTSEF